MIYSGPEIARVVRRTKEFKAAGQPVPRPAIDIWPFDDRSVRDGGPVGPNSYDVRLAAQLRAYAPDATGALRLDSRRDNPTIVVDLPESGFWLEPGRFYLGSTIERTSCSGVVPWLDGRSSIGRLSICVHATAGRGDDGFGESEPEGCSWTLEISVTIPVKIYPSARVGQLSFFDLLGERDPYRGRYARQDGPTASKMHVDNPGG